MFFTSVLFAKPDFALTEWKTGSTLGRNGSYPNTSDKRVESVFPDAGGREGRCASPLQHVWFAHALYAEHLYESKNEVLANLGFC